MKIKSGPKGLKDISKGIAGPRNLPFFTLESKYAHRPGETPSDAAARGVGYNGPLLDEKGKRDGACNRTACQLPLAGLPRWSMQDYSKGGRLYYCQKCVDLFHEHDRSIGQTLRCTIIEEDL